MELSKFLHHVLLAFILVQSTDAECQLPQFYNAADQSITLEQYSVVILASQLNCKGCYHKLKMIKRHVSKKVSWYSLHDFGGIPVSSRNKYIGYLKGYITLDVVEYLFLDELSNTSLRSTIDVCMQEQTPHLLLVKNGTIISGICYQQLFESTASTKDLARKINKFFMQ